MIDLNCNITIEHSLSQMELKQILLLVFILAFGMAIGLTLAIVGCAIYPNGWWAMFTIICYFFAPVPEVFGRLASQASDKEHPDDVTGWEHLGGFLSSFIATMGIGILFILGHVKAITWETFGYEVSGGITILFTLLCVLGAARHFSKV
ncbi:leptin receptor gene-related [Acrasis kona]|uniref:Leptin receptor gene-related n=1 Tax=Acrasis kona TaxID=1008807 RepID=A0AAW2ZRK0_9EUKA